MSGKVNTEVGFCLTKANRDILHFPSKPPSWCLEKREDNLPGVHIIYAELQKHWNENRKLLKCKGIKNNPHLRKESNSLAWLHGRPIKSLDQSITSGSKVLLDHIQADQMAYARKKCLTFSIPKYSFLDLPPSQVYIHHGNFHLVCTHTTLDFICNLLL